MVDLPAAGTPVTRTTGRTSVSPMPGGLRTGPAGGSGMFACQAIS